MRGEAAALEYLGESLLDLRKFRSAEEHFRSLLKIGLESAPSGDIVPEAYRRLAELATCQGKFEDAERAVEAGEQRALQLHDDYERVGFLRVRALLVLEQEKLKESDELFRQAISLAMRCGFRFEHALTLEYQGFAHRTTGRPDTADRLIADAKAIYEELGMARLSIRLGRGRRALSLPRPQKAVNQRDGRRRRWERFGLLTKDDRFLRVLEDSRRVADARLPVLLVGESGVGKELVVRAVHRLSRRRGALVDVNAAAIPETMLESELFGSRRGAYTGAEDRDGLVAEADGGTLFLDEIGDMPQPLQAKLLRFLENSTYRPVGGGRPRQVDVRFICATNASLAERMRRGRFRRDLYHRIAGRVLHIPALRERPKDILLLAEHFTRLMHAGTEAPPSFDPDAIACLERYGWPGNVRELKHAVESAVYALGPQKKISTWMLPREIGAASGQDIDRELDVERIRNELMHHDGSVSAAARALGMTRQTLYRKINALEIDLEALRGSS